MTDNTKLHLIDLIIADALELQVFDQGIILAIGSIINFQEDENEDYAGCRG